MTSRETDRCKTLSGHLMLILFHGWCPCGYNGCPRTKQELDQRHVEREPA